MAEGSKKSSPKSKGSSSKAVSASPKKSFEKKATQASKKQRYEKLLAARHAMEEARADVLEAELAARRAYAYQGDFVARDAAYAKALSLLNEARERATEATTNFQIMKMKKGA
jgi:hypothetical protein